MKLRQCVKRSIYKVASLLLLASRISLSVAQPRSAQGLAATKCMMENYFFLISMINNWLFVLWWLSRVNQFQNLIKFFLKTLQCLVSFRLVQLSPHQIWANKSAAKKSPTLYTFRLWILSNNFDNCKLLFLCHNW